MKSKSLSRALTRATGAVFLAIVTTLFTQPIHASFIRQGAAFPGVYNSAVEWGDFDNDRQLDFVLTGLDSNNVPRCLLFRNLGDGTFTNSAVLTGVYRSAVAWGDYDNDGHLDLLVTGATTFEYPYAPATRLYRNEGNGKFSDAGAGLPGVYTGSVAWGDYDKDGDLDLVLTGWTDTVRIARIYRNEGGSFTDSGNVLKGVGYSSVAWGDYDNDGDLDLLMTGLADSGRITRIYRNGGEGSLAESGIALTGVSTGSAGWGDYDNDGDLDLFLCGSTGSARVSKVFVNQGNDLFVESGNALFGLSSSSGAWGDYDNDGDLDLFLMGTGDSGPVSLLYANHGNGSLADSGTALPGMASGSAAWGDYDNSSQLDLLLTGFDINYTPTVYLGRNILPITNSPPQILTGLTTRLFGRDVTMSWNPAVDDHTPATGLHYNLRLGTLTQGCQKVSPLADPTNGFRRVVRLGNGTRTNSWTVKGLPDGTYFWSVQAIDTALAGGAFATDVSFIVPSNPPTDISLSSVRVIEGLPPGITVGILNADDLNADDTHTFTLVPGLGDEDNTAFNIVTNALNTAVVFDFEGRSSYQIRVRATDPGGLWFEKRFVITIVDVNDPPQAICTNVTVMAGANGNAHASVDNGSFDPDGGDAVALSQSPQGPYPAGTNTVILTVTDTRGVSNSCVATVIVRDVTPPDLRCPETLTLEAPPGTCDAVLSYYPAVTATDNCNPPPVVTSIPPAGTSLPVGRTPITCVATDASGNASSCSFTVSVFTAGQEIVGTDWLARETIPTPPAYTWRSVACSGSGTVIAAVTEQPLMVSTNYGSTWTERAFSGMWQSVACSANGAKMVAALNPGYIYTSSDFGATWTQRGISQNWSDVASSADGARLVAVVYSGQIYTSSDSGVSWTPREAVRAWSSVACSATGDVIIAASRKSQGITNGQLYVSTDYGATWAARESDREWSAVSVSTAGDFMVAATGGTNGQIYTSVDYGATWTPCADQRAWSSVACLSYDLIVAAAYEGPLFISTDRGQSWIERETNRAWSSLALSPDLSNVYAAAGNGQIYWSSDRGMNWEVAAATRFWRSIASSTDGTRLIAAASDGLLYTSNDSGTNWIERDTSRLWYSVGSSADGTKLIAAVDGGRIYTSSDSGTHWVPRENNRAWHCVVSSADGSKLVAAAYGGQLYTSTDYGESWVARDQNRNWSRIASSGDGTKLAATVYGGSIHISTNSGASWSPRAFPHNWSAVACSADGTKMAATIIGGQIFLSADSGTTWSPRESNRNWSSIAASADGTKWVATVYGGRIYSSTNSGDSWLPRESTRAWSSICSSYDGGRLAAAVYGGRIYTSVPTRLPRQQPTILGAADRVVGATTPAGAIVNFEISATNVCQPNIPVTCVPPSGSLFAIGTNTVTCVAVDAFATAITNSFSVEVVARPEKGGWGQALTVDGLDDHASVASIDCHNTPLTIELWARRDSTGTWDAMVAQGTNTSGQGLLFAFRDDNRVTFSFSAEDLVTVSAYADPVWHHWAATYSPTVGRRIFRDGVLVASDTNTTPFTGTGTLLIGSIPWTNSGFFHGAIDDVRIWKEARTEQQIRADMLHPLNGMATGLLAYWSFNGDSATAVHDLTLTGHNGILMGNPALAPSTVPPWGHALAFYGTNTVQIPGFGQVMPTNEVTVEFWLRRATNQSTWPAIFYLDPDQMANRFAGFVGASYPGHGNLFWDFGDASDHGRLNFNSTESAGVWQHYAFVASQSGNYMKVFTNGVLERSIAGFNDFARGDYTLHLTTNFVGELDEFRIWTVARSQEEIAQNLVRPLTGNEAHLVACWNFDEGAGITAFDSAGGLRDGTLIAEPIWVNSTVGRPPIVTPLKAVDVVSAGLTAKATLNGLVHPCLAPTVAWFEWGVTAEYDSRTPSLSLASGPVAVPFLSSLAGLVAGQVYHYRLVAQNCYGLAIGPDQILAPLFVTVLGNNPTVSQVGAAFTDPGVSVMNSGGMDLGAQSVVSGTWHSLALTFDGRVLGWGADLYSQANGAMAGRQVARIAAGGETSLALNSDGTVIAWGRNIEGQANVPAGLTGVAEITAGGYHSLALRTNGMLVGWGHNAFGQANMPAGFSNVTKIAAGEYHSLALKADGTVLAWGYNNFGQINTPSTATNVVGIAAGGGHSLALRGDGTVVGWGRFYEGQITVPDGLSNVIAIAAGANHSLALRNDGRVVAWGNNNHGQATVPSTLSNVVAIAGGYWHSLALRSDGTLVGWGDSRYGQAQGMTIVTSGAVGTTQPSIYSLTYAVTNIHGWAATATRSVRIVDRPALITQPVINVTSGTVALQSRVNPNGLETLSWFEWGAAAGVYTNATYKTNQADGFEFVPCSTLVGDLVPKATYHYRAAASNQLGAVYGPDATFTVFSTDAQLASLTPSEAELTPGFTPEVGSYASTVPNQVGYLFITPVSADSGATIRVSVNGDAATAVTSGTASRPLFLNQGYSNLVEVLVTAQDGVTTKSYAINIYREAPLGTLVGPSFPPPLGVVFNQIGTDEQVGREAGKTWLFSDATMATQTALFWGATNKGVKLSFNDSAFEANEILTYNQSHSSLAEGIAIWSGQTLTLTGRIVYTRFILAVTNTATGKAIPLVDATSLGLNSNIGAVVRVTPGLGWKAVLRFQASFSTNGPFESSLAFFDREVATNYPTALAYSSFGAGFYHLNTPPQLTANQKLSVNRSASGTIDLSLLSASDIETGPAQLKFTIAPQGQGGSTRNGKLRLNGAVLAQGHSFTQADINNNRVVYEHSGSCETNDDFTFNVTDQHGGTTPTGDHTTYTFRIAITQPNIPPVALNGSGSTGLQAPYHGTLPATNGDCAPQILTFRLTSPGPTKGVVSLVDAQTGAFTYTPDPGQQGVDFFRFQVNDGEFDSFDDGRFTITVSNQSPLGVAGSGSTRENVQLTSKLAAIDPDLPAQALTFAIASNGTKGFVIITNAASGSFIYTPNPGAIGSDVFSFKVSDGTLLSAPANFTVTIRPNLEDGDLLVSDWGAKQIVLVDRAGAQGVVSTGGLLASPRGLAVEPAGTILVMDGVNGLLRIDPVGGWQNVVSGMTNFSTEPFGPWGLALEPGGTVLVADGLNGVLRIDSSTGARTTLASGDPLVLPLSLTLSRNGEVFVGDAAAPMGQQPSRIVRINTSTGEKSILTRGTNLFLPTGIAIEPAGDLLVTEAPTLLGSGSDVLLRVNIASGSQTVVSASNFLANPIGVVRDLGGSVYVANMGSGDVIAVNAVTGQQTMFSPSDFITQAAGIASVQIQAPNLLTGLEFVGGTVELQFQGRAGVTYTLERSSDLESWKDVATATATSKGVVEFLDPNPSDGKGFYRVRLP